MWYVLLSLLALLVAVLLLRLRVRFNLTDSSRLLFIGLGESGPELDFVRKVGVVKLFGVLVKSFVVDRGKKEPLKKREKKARKVKAAKPPKPKRVKPSFHDLLNVLPRCIGPLWRYIMSLSKDATVEELEGRVAAGFDSPHLTGSLFGYYQAALAAAPGVFARVQFVPDWVGPSFSGTARVSVAIPVYKLLARTAALVYRLPLRDLLKLAIGRKKGVSDVQQRR